MVPSQALSDTQQEPTKFPAARSTAKFDDDSADLDSLWDQTFRPLTFDPTSLRHPAHSRESSAEKFQLPPSVPSPRAHGLLSRSSAGGGVIAGVGGAGGPGGAGATGAAAGAGGAASGTIERPLEPGKLSYGHHRQTSIVHGFQHSRNGSHTSSSSSPLSPQLIAAVGLGLDAQSVAARLEADAALQSRTAAVSPASPPTSTQPQPGTLNGPGAPTIDRSSTGTSISISSSTTQRKVERMQSRSRRDHPAHQSYSSRTHKDEQKTVGEYALHVLFTSFIAQAEEKLSECMTMPLDPEPPVEKICGPGVDPGFDQLIVALGHIASPKPKALIDSMMLWRKSKSDAANEARAQLQQMRNNLSPGPLTRRNTEPGGPPSVNGSEPAPSGGSTLAAKQESVAQAERRSTVSIYILCRVLLEVVCQSTLSSITPEMEDRLETIIFGQLKIADNEQLLASPLKMANWNLFAQLLGHMSDINFVGVTKRFVEDLDGCLQERALKNPASITGRDAEGKMDLVLGGMKHLKLKITPDEAWEQSCDFLVSLGRLFTKSHGQRVKTGFCQVIEGLLLPVAAKASNDHLMHPKWAEVLTVLGPRLSQMFTKPRHWPVAFPLTATMLCVSPPGDFGVQWLQMVLPLQTKVKDRITRPLCLHVISRLLWTYLYRTNDSAVSAIRKLDDVLRLVLPSPKRNLAALESAVTEPLIQILRLIGFKYPEYCFKNAIFPLINAELLSVNREYKVEQLDPERIVIGIRAFLCIVSDLEKGEQGRPSFPQLPGASPASERPSIASPSSSATREVQIPARSPDLKAQESSRLVLARVLSDSTREYYNRFCEILGKITIICDNTFGGQAALDEKFGSPGPRTPITETFAFARRDEQTTADQKQAFYELLHVAVQALPRCLPTEIPFNSLINLLCTGTAHVQLNIAESSANSLKAIARQSHAQQVTMGFARFIFNFDDRYSTMSDGGMLGTSHIENTLRLYVELLQIWIEEIRQKTRDVVASDSTATATDKRGLKLDLSSIWAEVDQAEAHGLFFLCSQSRRVRHFAITVLRLIIEFDKALGKEKSGEKEAPRLIDILENESSQVMSFDDEHLSVAERSRVQRGLQKGDGKGAVLELCTSDISYDTTVWFKIFPNLIRIFFDRCPFAVAICRDLICNRILQMYKPIVFVSEPSRGVHNVIEAAAGSRPGPRSISTQPETMVEQWQLYLIFACTTMADPGLTPANVPKDVQHTRKSSKPSPSAEKIVTARTLFKYLIPLLSASSHSVRDAVVAAMGSINVHIYQTLLEELQGQISRCNDEARARIHQRTNSSPRRNRKMDLLRTEITHVFKLTSNFLKEPVIHQSDFFLTTLTAYAKDLKIFLMDGEVQMDWEFQKLRRYYCGLVESLFEGINKTRDPSRWMTFESRKSAFSLMEDWCGFSPNQTQIRAREDNMRQTLIDQQSLEKRGPATAAMEIEKRNLRNAALSAMASLCGGPLSFTTESGVTLQFDVRRMLAWIEAIFNSGSDKMTTTGRRALKNLAIHNKTYPYLLEHCIARCYLTDVPKVLESYFIVAVEVLQEHPDYPCPSWKLLALCLYTLGNDSSEIRRKSAAALRSIEARSLRNSKISDFDISISDKTQAVYKLAQFEISKRLASQYTELAFHVISEFTLYFKDLQPAAQRNVVAVVLPWIQAIELKLDPNGGPTAQSFVLLANLLEITIKSSGALHHEVQALWQALAAGPYPGNVRLVLDFIMQLCLERREQNFVEYAKQIVVFLSTTNSTPGIKVVEFLLMQINPKAMVPNEKRDAPPAPADMSGLPYCADLAEVLPMGTKQAGFSLGQLSLILLVDLMVSPVLLTQDNVPLLLQVVTVLWDHYTPLVQEQAREMLVHLIHELVISRMDDRFDQACKDSIEGLVALIRRHDRCVVWSYEDSNGKVEDQENKVPPSMEYLTAEVVRTFEYTFPGIKEQWGRLSLTWATSCPVRHLACRSFQIFRCVLTSIDQFMLGDMLARLSNTIADEDAEIQSFSMEILTTVRTVIVKLDAEKILNFPQLFWTICACLESINEREYLEALEMLNELLRTVDFRSSAVRRLIGDGQPARWEATFEGLQPLLHKGLRSSLCWQPTLDTMDKLVKIPSDSLIGDDNRLFFALLANFPRFVHELEGGAPPSAETVKTCRLLLGESDRQGLEAIGLVLDDYVSGRSLDSHDFMQRYFDAVKEYYLPRLEFKTLTFLIGLLTNSLSWVKTQTMRILCTVIPSIDMRSPEIAGHGSDLISPLLRLLQTEFCMDALKVLDNIMTMSGSHMDKHHLRMSMTRATSKAVRKEYEHTQSLFGIPEASGWAIPVPAQKTESTRANIHAVFYMCQSAEGSSTEATPTAAEVEFHNDEFPYGYFDIPDRTETMLSDEVRGDAHSSDLVMKLDSLDSFFDEASSPAAEDDKHSSVRGITEFAPEAFESGTQLYDEKILPILHEASNSSSLLPNGFADRPHFFLAREYASNAMTPGAFSAASTTPRPGAYPRSIASSAPTGGGYFPPVSVNGGYFPPGSVGADLASDDEYSAHGELSDADDERQEGWNSEGLFALEGAATTRTTGAAVPARPPNLRRLTSRSRERQRDNKPPPQPVHKMASKLYVTNVMGQGDVI